MLRRGLLEEVRGLLSRYDEKSLKPSLRTIGYAQALEYLSGTLPEAALHSAISMATRRFAKRQLTYFRNEPQKRGWQVRPAQPFNQRSSRKQADEFTTITIPKKEMAAFVQRELASLDDVHRLFYLNCL